MGNTLNLNNPEKYFPKDVGRAKLPSKAKIFNDDSISSFNTTNKKQRYIPSSIEDLKSFSKKSELLSTSKSSIRNANTKINHKKDIEQALHFSNQFLETFLRNDFSCPLNLEPIFNAKLEQNFEKHSFRSKNGHSQNKKQKIPNFQACQFELFLENFNNYSYPCQTRPQKVQIDENTIEKSDASPSSDSKVQYSEDSMYRKIPIDFLIEEKPRIHPKEPTSQKRVFIPASFFSSNCDKSSLGKKTTSSNEQQPLKFSSRQNATFNILDGQVFSFQKEFNHDRNAPSRNNKFTEIVHELSNDTSRNSSEVFTKFDKINSNINNLQEAESFEQMGNDFEDEHELCEQTVVYSSGKKKEKAIEPPYLQMLRRNSSAKLNLFNDSHINLSKINEKKGNDKKNEEEQKKTSTQDIFHQNIVQKIPAKQNDHLKGFLQNSSRMTLIKLEQAKNKTSKLDPEKNRLSSKEKENKSQNKRKILQDEIKNNEVKTIETKNVLPKRYQELMGQKRTITNDDPKKKEMTSMIRQAFGLKNDENNQKNESVNGIVRVEKPNQLSNFFKNESQEKFDEDSNEMKVYQNILSDLKHGSSKKGISLFTEQSNDRTIQTKESSKKLNEHFQSSKESSKTNIKININDLAKKVAFNIDNCFK